LVGSPQISIRHWQLNIYIGRVGLLDQICTPERGKTWYILYRLSLLKPYKRCT